MWHIHICTEMKKALHIQKNRPGRSGSNRAQRPYKDELFVQLMQTLTFGVQQPGDAQFSLCHAEGLLQILLVALPVHLAHV